MFFHVLIMVARGPCSAFGTCFLLLHPGITDQEHPKKHAVESLKKSHDLCENS